MFFEFVLFRLVLSSLYDPAKFTLGPNLITNPRF